MTLSNEQREEIRRKVGDRFFGKINFTDSCWVYKGALSGNGYGGFYFYGRMMPAHRYAFECFNGKIPNNMLILHRCDVKLCVNPEHHFLGTHQDNSDDKMAKGRDSIKYGENNGRAKLKIEDVEDIRKKYKPRSSGESSTSSLAMKYGVTKQTILLIVGGKRWNKSA